MISEMHLRKYFWVDVINTACYVLNRIIIRHVLDKTPYELLRRKDKLGDTKTNSR